MNYLIYLSVSLFLSSKSVSCERKDIHHMMYETFKNSAMCFRILNGTNQFGCSTSQSGSTGVVHFVNNNEDLQWLLEIGKAGPYMAIVPPKLFVKDVMMKLRNSPQVSGVVLAINGTGDRPANMSPDDTCPNRYSSLSGSCDDSSPWNPLGNSFLLVDWNVPLFVVKNPVVLQQIYDCFVKFNMPLDNSQTERSLCSLQMTGHMYAAVDTPTCLRRNSLINSFNPLNYCDPMGDQNLVVYQFPRNSFSAAPNNSVVLVTARFDAAAMFDGLAPGAETTVSGIVTLITAAHLLSQILPQYKETYKKNVMFALLNGEAQDYIGSSRMVYDMQQGTFPMAGQEDLTRLEHLDQVIDLNQLDATKQLHLHCLSSSTAQSTVDLLKKTVKPFNVSVEGSCSPTSKLPPSSLHSFLKANSSIPGIILTNHASQYTNKYYNGLLDDTVNVGYKYANGSEVVATSLQSSLASMAQGLALTLAQMVDSSASWPANITNDAVITLVDKLLYCYLEDRQCEMFQDMTGNSVGGTGPMPLYVGVSRSPNQITTITFTVLANLTGKQINGTTEQQCSNMYNTKKVVYRYFWSSVDTCLETGIHLTPAVSPAFSIDNYNWTSGEYSSWTESVWPELSLRMFLRPAFSQELTTLISGLIVLFFSFTSVYWINRNAEHLFTPLIPGESESLKDTSFLLGEMRTTTYGNVSV